MSTPDFKQIKKNADKGDHISQFNLAMMYGSGIGVSTDGEKCIKYLKMAADGGVDRAQLNLGTMYRQNDKMDMALKYYQMGADQGHRECMKNVGYFHYEGLGGLERDYKKAFEWYKKVYDHVCLNFVT